MQKKNRKGFTLIELLAVIVILAIIALIAVPVIMNVITKARKSAFEDSAYGIVKAGEMYYTNKLLDTEGMTGDKEFIISNGAFVGDALDVSGSLPSSGKVTVTSEGKVALAISNGEYCIRKATNESSVKAELLEDLVGVCNYKTAFTTATGEAEVPACITNNTECTAEAIKNGLKVGVKVNDTQTYDFYVIKDESNKLTLIMDRNIDDTTIAWISEEDYGCGSAGDNCSQNDKGPKTALAYLKTQTSGWSNIPETTYTLSDTYNSTPKYEPIENITARARLITYTEANKLGCTGSLGSCPTWLYENLSSSSGPYGYWTSSAYAGVSYYAWGVCYGGDIYHNYVYRVGYGIRPVITISKSVL